MEDNIFDKVHEVDMETSALWTVTEQRLCVTQRQD